MSEPHMDMPVAWESALSVALNGWFWGQVATGSGQYVMRLIHGLLELPTADQYTVFVPARYQAVSEPCLGDERVRIVPLATPFDRLSVSSTAKHLAKVWFEQVSFPRACRLAGVEVAHVPYWGPPASRATPVVTTVHDLIPLVLPAYRGSAWVRLYTELVRWTVRRSALVLTDSHASAHDIGRLLNLPAERVRVIYLGVESQYQPVREAERLDRVRARYRLPERFILYLGGFDQRKNVPRLIRAYRRLLSTMRAAPPLVIAGRLPERDSPLFPDPLEEIQTAELAERVQFIGWVAEEDKPALYSLATCFVYPSLYEGFGLPVLEAMACGTPVVVSDGSALSELAGEGGILADPLSETDIAKAIEVLVGDEQLRSQRAAAAYARARQFHWTDTARFTRAAYLSVLSETKKVRNSRPSASTRQHQEEKR